MIAPRKLSSEITILSAALGDTPGRPSEMLARMEEDLVFDLVRHALRDKVWPERPTITLTQCPPDYGYREMFVLRATAVAS